MYTLLYAPGTCSMAVHVALEEAKADYELKKVTIHPKAPELLEVNPRGAVPVLLDDGFVIREGAAILVYMLEKEKSDLLPASGKERAAALEWLMFANSTLHPAYGKVFAAKGAGKLDEAKAEMTGRIQAYWDEVEQHLNQHAFIAGDRMTAADILLTVIANWTPGLLDIAFGPKTKALFRTVTARPAFQKALATEQVTYKAAA